MERRAFLVGLGAAGMGSGAIIHTDAFTNVSGDRALTVGTADDPNAVLGLGGVSDAGTTPTFTNNSGQTMWVQLDSDDSSVTFDIDDDDSPEGKSVDFTLSGDPAETLDVGVSGDSQSVPVDVSAEIRNASGVTKSTVSLTRTYAVPQADQVVLEPNVTPTGNSGKYEFKLTNGGNIDVTIEAIGVNDSSNPDVVEVTGDGILNVGGTSVMTNSIPIDTNDSTTVTRVDFDSGSNVDLPANSGQASTKTFEFARFRDSQGGNAKMKNENVTATFYFTDGSSKTVTMTP